MIKKNSRVGGCRGQGMVTNLGSMLFCKFFGWMIFLVRLMIVKAVRGESGKGIRDPCYCPFSDSD